MLVPFWEKLALPTLAKFTKYDMWTHMNAYNDLYKQAAEERHKTSLKRLQEVCAHAYENVPHYTRKFDSVGIKPSDIQGFDDLERIPITTKAEIKAAFPHDMIARNYKDETLRSSQSGATSGDPLHVRMDFEGVMKKYAEITRHELHNGWHVGDKTVHSQPCPYVDYYERGLIKDGTFTEGLVHLLSLRKNLSRDLMWYLENYVVFPVLHRRLLLYPVISLDGVIDDDLTRDHLRRIAEFEPTMVRSHPLYSYLWAREIEAGNMTAPKVGAIEVTGGLASEKMQEITARAFNTKVYDYYGSAEIGGIAAECEHLNGMHVYDNILWMEFLRGGKKAKPMETSSIVITDFLNYAMPFIRYWTDDVGRYHEPGVCGCGLDTVRMEVDGRTFEMLVDKDGTELTSKQAIDKILGWGDLYLFQLILEKPGKATLHVMPGRQPEDEVEKVLVGLRDLMGEDWTVDVNWTDRLKPEKRGKYCFIKCLYKQELPGLFPSERPD